MSLLLRRRGLLMQQNKTLLPKEYQQVDYIESTGTQYIDLGIKATDKSKFEIQCQFIIPDSTACYISGVAANYVRLALAVYYVGGDEKQQYFSFMYGHRNYAWMRNGDRVKADENKHTFALQGDGQYWTDGERHETSNTDTLYDESKGLRDMLIFAGETTSSGALYHCHMKLWSYKFYDNYETNNLVRDLVPCYRKSDKKPGLYDLVNGVFYMNQGDKDDFKTGGGNV